MKHRYYLILPLLLAFIPGAEAGKPKLDNDERNSSYALGVDYMKGLREDELSLDNAAFLQGLRDVQGGKAPRLDAAAQRRALDYFIVKRLKQRQLISERTLAAGQAFLHDNLSQPGVIQQASGLQYQVLEAGGGQRGPGPDEGVDIRYRLNDIQGQQIMASPSGGSQQLAMNAIFPGLREALSLMKIGDKWRVFIPPELAFGANGSSEGRVKPNQTLVYELELLNIVPASQAKAEMEKPTIIDDKPTTIQSE